MIQSVWKNLTGLIPAEHLWCDFKWKTHPKHHASFALRLQQTNTSAVCVQIQKHSETGVLSFWTVT